MLSTLAMNEHLATGLQKAYQLVTQLHRHGGLAQTCETNHRFSGIPGYSTILCCTSKQAAQERLCLAINAQNGFSNFAPR
jgi:hypothetical protein